MITKLGFRMLKFVVPTQYGEGGKESGRGCLRKTFAYCLACFLYDLLVLE
jgi:hypothetical protein